MKEINESCLRMHRGWRFRAPHSAEEGYPGHPFNFGHGRGRRGERGFHEGRHGRHGFGGGRERLFDAGDIKLVGLNLLSEQPSYRYQLIKAMEERLSGGYAPSPGVIYPTLTMLE